jgi:ATP-dependent Clp protease ATP-binding subunit ClpB
VEIKGHRDVWNLLLQLFDEGHLTDSHGRKVDFRNVIVVMTSNMGAEVISQLPAHILGSEPEVRSQFDVLPVWPYCPLECVSYLFSFM